MVLFLFIATLAWPGSCYAAYWNVFNIEGESTQSALIDTYATLSDMLNDTNQTGSFEPNAFGFGKNVVGSGADIIPPAVTPLPAALPLFATGLVALGLLGWRRKRKAAAMAA